MPQPQLSLCLIVRDEAGMLPDFLAGVVGLWDELIAVDTGSTDNSVALLTEAGARITHLTWQNDFAAARNASLAAATGRWILYLDADERPSPAVARQIRDLLADPEAGAATVVMRNTLPDGSRHEARLLRLFRRDPAIRFRHRIHEDAHDDVMAFLARENLQLRHLDGVVDHLGYVRTVAAAKNKRERDQKLLRQVIAADPTDFYCWFKLLESARFWHDKDLWRRTAREVAPLLTEQLTTDRKVELQRSHWSGELAALISEGLFSEPAAALAWLERWRDHFRTGAAWHLRRALLLETLRRNDEAVAALQTGLAALEPAAEHLHPRFLMGQCRLAIAMGDPDLARTHCTRAVAVAPTDAEALLAAVSFSVADSQPTAVADFAADHLQQHPGSGAAVAEALLRAGQAEVAADLLARLSPADPPLALGHLTCALALGRDVALDVDLSAAEAETAFQHWIRILWDSRRTPLLVAFADNCATVTGLFPWLPDFLATETRRLQNGDQ